MLRLVALLSSVAVSLLGGETLFAHTVKMKDGTVYEGEVVTQSDAEVVIETTFDGRKTVARGDVMYVDTKTPPLREQLAFRAKEAADVEGRWDLYKWAKKKGFKKELEYILEAIVDLKPDDRRARKLLGHTKVDGKWMSPDQIEAHEQAKFEAAQRAKGLVLYEGKWVTPGDREAMEKGLLKDGDDWVTEAEWHARRGEKLVGGKWVKVGQKEGKELAARVAREGRVKVGYRWSPHFDAVTGVKPELTERVLGDCEKLFAVMRRTLRPTGDEYPEVQDERIKLALFTKVPAYVRFSKWFDKAYDVESLRKGWVGAIQRQHSWWHIQDERWVGAYQFPDTERTFASIVGHNVGLIMLTRYRANFDEPSVWLREGFAYYCEIEAYGYTDAFSVGGGGSGGAAAGVAGAVWRDAKKWQGALQKLVGDGMDPPLRRIAKMGEGQLRYAELVKSWSVVECLIRLDPVRFKKFIDLSKDRSKKEEDALIEAFGMSYRQLDQKWRGYVTGGFKH